MLKKLLAGFLAITVTLSSMTMPQSVSAETTNTHAVSQSAQMENMQNTSQTMQAADMQNTTQAVQGTDMQSMSQTTQSVDMQNTQGVTSNNELTVEGTNSFGNLLTDMLSEEMDEQQQNDGCNIFSAEVYDTEVVVDFESTQDATLVAAIYEEDGTKLLASGSLEVYQGEKQAVVSIETESMPQYFYLRCFLIDSETLKPLCTSYESPNYTKEMQEFLAKTTEDFDEEKVLNFDDDTTNNFAVYSDTTQIIPQNEGVNEVVSANDIANTYTIEHADEEITSLQQGDIFAYEYEGGNVLIVKVDSISLDTTDPTNTIATITGMETSMEEVFDYVKIDESAGLDKAEIDPSNLGEGVIYNGLVEREDDGVQTYAVDEEGSVSDAISCKFEGEQIGPDAFNAKLWGEVEMELEATAKVYLALDYQYVELKLEYEMVFDLAISGNAEGKIPLPFVKVAPVPGVVFQMIPAIWVKFSVETSFAGKISGTVGFSIASDSGIKNLTTKPQLDTEIKIEGTLFIGVILKPEVKVISEKIANAKLEVEIGAEAKGELVLYDSAATTEKHTCSHCIDGEIYWKAEANFEAQLLKIDKLKFEFKKSIKSKICDFYFSIDKKKFGFSTCPYRNYKVTVTVKDENGGGLNGALVNGEYTTDNKGRVSFYLPNGKYTIKTTKDGYSDSKKKITIKEDAKSITVKMAKDGTASGEPEIPGKAGKKVSLAWKDSAAIMEDGSLYMWGSNEYGMLGDGTEEDKVKPTKVMDNVIDVSLGDYHSGAITKDGSLYMWGSNSCGRLGDGTEEDKVKPTKVMENVVDVSLGAWHSGAVTEDGSLYMWGYNENGQLGDGTYTDKVEPVKVMENVVKVSRGDYYHGAITEDGSLYMWGSNNCGQLGDGTYTDKAEPTKVMENVVDVSLGKHHSGAITEDGSLYMWGDNIYGRLGDGTEEDHAKPIKVMENVVKISLGDYHSGAITEDGSLYMWGSNAYGQLGDGIDEYKVEPIKVMENVVDVSLGAYHNGVITEDGSIYMWGCNEYGGLGDGTTIDSSVPIKIIIPYTTTSASTVDNYFDAINASMESVNTVDGDNSAMTEPTITEDTDNPSLKTASFADLSADEVYNFYAMKSNEEENSLSANNLLYIHQATADSDGNLSITYEMREDYDSPKIFLVGSSRKNISAAQVSISNLQYNKTEQFVSPAVIYNGVTLVEGVDYELTGDYSATDIGEYILTIEGIGDYIGKIEAKYSVYCEHEYDDGEITKEATCTEKGVLTYSCENCSHTKTEEIPLKGHTYDAGKATKKASFGQNGQFTKTCVSCGHTVTSVINGIRLVELYETSYRYYRGVAWTPNVRIKDSAGKSLKSSAYTITYAADREKVGVHNVVISFKGNYSGTVVRSFTVYPETTSISKLKAQKKAITVKWKKQTRQTTGYEIAYSTSKKFTKKTTKTVTVKSNKKTSRVLSKLKAKKKYYVKIRTYKTVKVNGKKTKIYGKWSKVKSIKTK